MCFLLIKPFYKDLFLNSDRSLLDVCVGDVKTLLHFNLDLSDLDNS